MDFNGRWEQIESNTTLKVFSDVLDMNCFRSVIMSTFH